MDITDIEGIVRKLPKKDRELFNRFYSTKTFTGRLKITDGIREFTKSKFGSVKKVENQKIISLNNNFTAEGSLFNKLRSSRPMKKVKINLDELEKDKECLFCKPLEKTPQDVFGRVEGKYCITAGNIAKYDYFHSLIIFNEHNPLKIKKHWLKDYLETAEKWFKKVKEADKESKYDFLMWNHLWKAGASIVHGHMQVTSSKQKYARIKREEEIVRNYKKNYKSNYFKDLFRIHNKLGLGKKIGKTRILFYLTPIKEKEIFMISEEKRFPNMYEVIYKVLQNYFKLGVQSFNFSLYKVKDYWVARIVDRGHLENRNSDMGAMELYGNSVVASDPFKLAKKFKL